MNDFVIAALLGIVEGLTEFIPVSSTGHLILAGDILKFKSGNTETFDIAIQLGAILAIVILYKKYFLKFLSPKTWFRNEMNKLLIAMIPVIGVSLVAYKTIKTHLFSSTTVAVGLFIGAIMMIGVELWLKKQRKSQRTKTVESVSYVQAFLIGICQCAALWPGMSRSGSTMIGGLIAGLDYETAAKFSFIVAVPVMTAATGYDLLKSWHLLTSNDFQLIGIGFTVSFFVAAVSVLTFLKWLSRLKLTPFAIYRIFLAGAIGWIYIF